MRIRGRDLFEELGYVYLYLYCSGDFRAVGRPEGAREAAAQLRHPARLLDGRREVVEGGGGWGLREEGREMCGGNFFRQWQVIKLSITRHNTNKQAFRIY